MLLLVPLSKQSLLLIAVKKAPIASLITIIISSLGMRSVFRCLRFGIGIQNRSFSQYHVPSLRVDPLFKRRKDLRNNEQKLATVSSRFLELNLYAAFVETRFTYYLNRGLG